jgi:hypothetical protein
MAMVWPVKNPHQYGTEGKIVGPTPMDYNLRTSTLNHVPLLPFALKAHILSHSSWSTAGISGTKTHYHL